MTATLTHCGDCGRELGLNDMSRPRIRMTPFGSVIDPQCVECLTGQVRKEIGNAEKESKRSATRLRKAADKARRHR